MRVKVLADKCIGCDSCSVICSLQKYGAIRPKAAGIRVVKDPWEKIEKPVVCRQCKKAPCVMACPSGALNRHPENGTVVLDGGLCNGCGICVATCPFQAIFLDDISRIAVKCDLCAGLDSPLCVQVCPAGVLLPEGREEIPAKPLITTANAGRPEGEG